MAKGKRISAIKSKGRRVWVPIIMHLLFVLTATVILILLAEMFIMYVCFLKTGEAVREFEDVKTSYIESGIGGIDTKNTNMIIESNGQTVHLIGTDTCDYEDGVSLADLSYRLFEGNVTDYRIYPDVNNPVLKITSSGMIRPDENLMGMEVNLQDDRDTLDLPFWISEKLNDGSTLYLQVNLNLTLVDVIFIVIFIGITSILVLTVFITILINSIHNVVRENRLVSLLFDDPVSHNHNWVWFLFRSEKVLKRRRNAGKNFAVVSMSFVKYRNFVLCHSVAEGDRMLTRVYDVLSKSMRSDELVAHSTSANFPMLLRYSEKDEVKLRLQEMIAKLEVIDKAHKFAFQAGIDYPSESIRNRFIDIDKEYNNASTARLKLEQKSDESGIEIFDQEFVDLQKWIDKVEELQSKAISNEEFIVYYQPKYDPSENTLKGAEALIRWQSPELGFVQPGKFIDIFENNGFITEIDHYMLTHVARDQKRWLDEGLNCVPVSVNVSRVHFSEQDLADQIYRIVTREGCPAGLIEIELTESAFFDDKKAMIRTIKALQDYGFEVSMDDFGSGYSSLNSLKDLPLNVLKLDAGFFRDMEEDGRGRKVVAEAIQLAKSLDMKTVAEGVEEKDQVEFLASEGCDMIQGFYFAKPMPGNDFEQKIKESKAVIDDETASEE